MQNTHKLSESNIRDQKELINSLRSQPVIIVIRPEKDLHENINKKNKLFRLINNLSDVGVKHIEIGWNTNPNWGEIVYSIRNNFPNINLGAASVTSHEALKAVKNLNLSYAMSPFWETNLQIKSIEIGQLLIPGVYSPSEFNKAINFGYKVIKVFPASLLGINYLKTIVTPFNQKPFVIAAGGLTAKDINPWIKEGGYGAIALGREILKNYGIHHDLKEWFNNYI